jgi:hypothetical protein
VLLDLSPEDRELLRAWVRSTILNCPVERVRLGLLCTSSVDGSGDPDEEVMDGLVAAAETGLTALAAQSLEGRVAVLEKAVRLAAPGGNTRSLRKSTRKEEYLEALMDSCSLKVAAEAVGITTPLPYAWAKSDPEFREKWNVARKFAGLEEV